MSRTNSTVVDSKVVEMSLDNRNFEQNAETSMATLKKLQQALDFSNSADGIDDVSRSIKKVKFDSIISGVEETKGAFSALEAVAFGAFANIGKKASDMALKIATAIPNQIISGGKQRAMNMEQAKFQIEGLAEMTGATWEDIFPQIDKAVTDTAFGLDEAAVVASQLLASSVDIGDNMQHALDGIAGVAAMTNSSYGEIGQIFTTVAGQGKLMTMQLNQLSTRGINVAATLANQLGMTEDEVREFVHKGEIDFQTFADAMDAAFGEHAHDANKTFTGVFSNIKANLSKIGELFADPAYDSLRIVFASMLPVIKDIRKEIEPLAEKAGEFMHIAANGVAGFFDIVHSALSGEPIKNAGDEAVEEAENVVSNMEDIRQKALQVIRGDYTNDMAVRFARLAEEGFDPQQVQDYVNKVHELAGGTWNLTDAIMAQADAYFGDYAAMSKMSDEELLAAGMDQDTIDSLREAAKVIAEVGESAEMTAEEAKNLDNKTKFLYTLNNLFSGINTIFDAIGTGFKENFKGIKGLENRDFDPLSYLTTKALELSDAFDKFAKKHGEDISNILQGIASVGLTVADAFKLVGHVMLTIVGGVFALFGMGIMEAAGWIGKIVTDLRNWVVENEVIEKGLLFLRNSIDSLVNSIRSFFGQFANIPKIQNGFKKIKVGFQRTFSNIPEYLDNTRKAFKEFRERVKDMGGIRLDNLGEVFLDFKDNVLGKFLDLTPFKQVKAGVLEVVDGIRDKFEQLSVDSEGNETTFGKVWHTISGWGITIAQSFEKAKNKVKEFWKANKLGEFFSKQFKNFSNGFQKLWDDSIKFAKGLPEVFFDFFTRVKKNGGFTFKNLGNIFSAFSDTVGKYFVDFKGFSGLSDAFSILKEDAKAKLLEMGIDVDAIKENVKSAINSIIEWILSIPGRLSDFSLPNTFQSLLDMFSGKGKGTAILNDAEGNIKKSGFADTIIGFFSKFQDFFQNTDFGWVKELISVFLAFKAITGFSRISKSIKSISTGIRDLAKSFTAEHKASAMESRANALIKAVGAVALLALSIYLVSKIDQQALMAGAKTMGKLAIALIAFMGVSRLVAGSGYEADGLGSGLLSFVGAIAGVAALAGVLSFIPWSVLEKGLDKVKKIGILLLEAGLVLAIEARLAGPVPDLLARGLTDFVGAITKVAILATTLSLVPWPTLEDGLKKIKKIGEMLLGAMAILAIASRVAGGKSTISIGALVGVIAGVASALYLLSKYGDIDKYAPIADAISKVLLSLTAVIGILGMGSWTGGAKAAINIASFVGILAAIGGIFEAIDKLLISFGMGDDFDLISVIGDELGKIGEAIGKFIGGIGKGTIDKIGEVDSEDLEKLTNFIKDIAGIEIPKQGEFKWDQNGLSIVDQSLTSFAAGMKGIINAINSLGWDPYTAESIDAKTEYFTAIAAFTKDLAGIEIPVQSEFGWTEDGIHYVDQSLGTFAKGMQKVVAAINGVDTTGLTVSSIETKAQYFTAIADFVKRLASVDIPIQTSLKINILGGVYEHIDQSFGTFADGVSRIVDAMVKIEFKIDEGTLQEKTDYLNMVADFVGKLATIDIPVQTNETAILSWFGGGVKSVEDSSLLTFATGMVKVAEAMNELKPLAVTESDIELTATAVELMAKAASQIPDQPGWLTKWFSDNSLSRFATEMKNAIPDINAASHSAHGINVDNIGKVKDCVDAMMGVIEAMAPGEGATNWVANETAIGDYARMVDKVGDAFAAFDGLQNYGPEDIQKIPKIIDALVEVNAKLEPLESGTVFNGSSKHKGGKVDPFETLNQYLEKLSGISTTVDGIINVAGVFDQISSIDLENGDIYDVEIIGTLKTNVETLSDMITSLSGLDTSGVDKLTNAAESLAGADLSGAASKVSDSKSKKSAESSGKALNKSLTDGLGDTSGVATAMSGVASAGAEAIVGQTGAFIAAGRGLVSALVTGINSFRNTVKTAFSATISKGIGAAKNAVSDVKGLGIDFADGYANGISVRTSFVADAARKMVKAAKSAVKSEQNSASPSKETYKLGRNFIDGYTNAIRDFTSQPAEAARDMARGAIEGISDALYTVSNMIEGDNLYQPTITPILDLSEIQNRASGIESLLNTSPMMSMNLGTVAYNSTATRAMRANDDVVEAIETLGSYLESVPRGDTYNVNGITYDDGSNIASAVGDIVRAAKIERRA